MKHLPTYQVKAYGKGDALPLEATELFALQLAESQQPLPADRPDADQWSFLLTCAVTSDGRVLGGVHLDNGPVNGDGPIADKMVAYLERTFVRPEYRGQGVATEVLSRAIRVAADAGCEYIRCSNNWDNPAETALFRKCGFALVDLNGQGDEEPCYLAVRPVRNLGG